MHVFVYIQIERYKYKWDVKNTTIDDRNLLEIVELYLHNCQKGKTESDQEKKKTISTKIGGSKQNKTKQKRNWLKRQCARKTATKIKDNNIAVDTLPTGYHLQYLEMHKKKTRQNRTKKKNNINSNYTRMAFVIWIKNQFAQYFGGDNGFRFSTSQQLVTKLSVILWKSWNKIVQSILNKSDRTFDIDFSPTFVPFFYWFSSWNH